MDFIDLRSDTVTHPTPEMREAMSRAVVGDDVLREDPTVNQLQELAAKKLGKKAGLFVPSGTMGNLLAVMCHCGRGDEVIMGNLGHTFLFEGGGISALGGVFAHLLPNQKDGTISLADVEAGIRPDDIHQPPTRLLVLENTHNRCGGVALTAEYTRDAASLAHKHGMKLHIDGARIFNAAAALNVNTNELVKDADSVTFCLSKGLCAPVGSVLCGDEEFIQKARRLRKMLGGGMRQAGVLAAAGIIAIEKMSTRLKEDHRRAKTLADGLAQIPSIRFEMGLPQTNMVFPTLADDCKLNAADVAQKLSDKGIKVGVVGAKKFRMVTHYWIDDGAIDKTITAMREALL
jgi:threonine aldolase